MTRMYGHNFGENPDQKTDQSYYKISCKDELEAAKGFEELLNSRYLYCLLASIEKRLNDFGLGGNYTVLDILNETYKRAIFSFRKPEGYEISNLYGWCSSTSKYIILEIVRKEKKERETRYKLMFYQQEDFSEDKDSSQAEIETFERIHRILKNEGDAKMVYWRLIDELSWKEIAIKLIEEGYFNRKLSEQFVASIRKRGSRLIHKLRSSLK